MADTILGTDGIKDITINRQDMRESVYVIGRSGSGKTSFLENMIVQDIRNGYGLLVMEPHGDLLNKIINHVPEERLKDVYFFDPVGETAFPFGLNPFACRDTHDLDTFTQTLENVQNIFAKVFEMSHATPRLRQFVRNICLTLIGSGYTMTEIPNLLLDKSFRDRVPKYPGTELFWKTFDALPPREQAERSESTLDRIDDLITSPIIRNIVGQVQSIDFGEILSESKILLVKLDSAKEDLTSLLGSIIVSQLLSAVINRRNLPERRRRQFHVYLDEFQNFSSQSIAKLLAEGRKFGVGCVLSHQFKAQLDLITQGATSQVGSLVVFNVNPDDAVLLSGAFNSEPPKKELPEPTIPANVLDYLSKHPNEKVKAFYSAYVTRLQAALAKRERYETNYATYDKDVVDPSHDFGEGTVFYNRDYVSELLLHLEDLLYQTQVNSAIDPQKRQAVISSIAPLLCFVDYYSFLYWSDTIRFDARWSANRPSNETLLKQQEVLDLLRSFGESDIDLMRFHLFRGRSIDDSEYKAEYGFSYIRYKHYFNLPNYSAQGKGEFITQLKEYKAMPETEVISSFFKSVREYADIAKYSKSEQALVSRFRDDYRILLDKETGGAYTLEYFEKARWNSNYLTYHQQKKWDYHKDYREALERSVHLGGYYHSPGRFSISASVEEWLTALASNEAFVKFLADRLGYLTTEYRRLENLTSSKIWEVFAEECDTLYAYYGPRDRQENLLAATRMELETEISEFEKKVQKSQQIFDTTFQNEQQRLNLEKETQKARHDRFVTAFDAVLAVLLTDKGKIKISSTEWIDSPASQRTFSDMKNEIANTLVHLPRYTALVKVTSGEYRMTTYEPKRMDSEFPRKFDSIKKQTRAKYCRPRAEVEREIAERTQIQPIQRRGNI